MDEGNVRTIATRIVNKAAFTMPEQYALLLAAAQVKYPFAQKPSALIHDRLAELLLKIQNQRIVPKKYEVAEMLGVPVYSLDKIAAERGVEPFWTRTAKGKKQKRRQYVIRLILQDVYKRQTTAGAQERLLPAGKKLSSRTGARMFRRCISMKRMNIPYFRSQKRRSYTKGCL